jgi:hypothetical protein
MAPAPSCASAAKTAFAGRALPTGSPGQACGKPTTTEEKEGVGYECNNNGRCG